MDFLVLTDLELFSALVSEQEEEGRDSEEDYTDPVHEEDCTDLTKEKSIGCHRTAYVFLDAGKNVQCLPSYKNKEKCLPSTYW